MRLSFSTLLLLAGDSLDEGAIRVLQVWRRECGILWETVDPILRVHYYPDWCGGGECYIIRHKSGWLLKITAYQTKCPATYWMCLTQYGG